MNKVKEIFSSDKHADSGVTGHDSTAHSTGNIGHNSTGNTTGHNPTIGASSQAHARHLDEVAPPPSGGHSLPKQDTHLNRGAAEQAEHDHKHLAPVTHHTHQHHEVEEVERERHVDRHVHHVQHHVQPVHDTVHQDTQHHENIVAPTKIHEKHVNTQDDQTLFAGLNKHKDEYNEASKERTVIDRGEKVDVNTSHHVHHVIQPVIERDTHEHHVIHTKVPIHHETHEAPIVHQSVEHEPMKLKDFVAGGGDLSSKLTHDTAGVLRTNDESCQRQTEGPLDTLKEKLHLGDTKHDASRPVVN